MSHISTQFLARLLSHMAHRTTDKFPRTSQKGASFYRDHARFAAEKKAINECWPHLVGPTPLLAKHEDFVTVDEGRILVTRAHDRIVCFPNRCLHRQSPLVKTSLGQASFFTCPYHGWTYNLEGKLLGMPQKQAFPHMHDCAIKPNLVTIWHDLIFIQKQGEQGTLEALVSELYPKEMFAGGIGFHDYRFTSIETVAVAANWKLLLEAFLEAYHVPMVHKQSFAKGVIPHVSLFDLFGLNSRAVYPLKKLEKLVNADAVTSQQIMQCLSVLYFLFPNTIIAMEPFQMTMLQFVPKELDQTDVHMVIFAKISEGLSTALSPEELMKKVQFESELLKKGALEDFAIAEGIQQSLKLHENECLFYFGMHEGLITHFHESLERYVPSVG